MWADCGPTPEKGGRTSIGRLLHSMNYVINSSGSSCRSDLAARSSGREAICADQDGVHLNFGEDWNGHWGQSRSSLDGGNFSGESIAGFGQCTQRLEIAGMCL